MLKFVNLHLNSEYSLLKSSITIDSYISYAIKNSISTLALTDHNNMYGIDKFIQLCNKNKIKPIIGIDLDVEDFQLILLAKNYLGFQELNRLASLKTKQNITLNEINDKNLFIIDHPNNGFVKKNKKILDSENFYFNSMNIENPKAIIIFENKILEKSENETINILNSINKLNNINNDYPGFTNISDANEIIIKRTNWIADQCNVSFPKITSLFPKFKTEKEMSSLDYLKYVTQISFKDKNLFFKKENIDILKERIKYELSVIEKLNVSDYFLIIWDLMKWGRENNIHFGPGRGSSAGSIICFLLNITEINPLDYGLIFERFLNPERISMPDIDIDVQDNQRGLLIKYIQNKYGINNVAQIITFSRMTSKSAFRDVARNLEIQNSEVNIISKLIPFEFNLKDAYKKSASFRAKINEKEIYERAYKQSLKIENLPRQRGTHAAGIIISQTDLITKIPVVYEEDSLISQFSMENLEKWGMLKIDLLGLRTLATIQNIIDEIYLKTGDKILLKNINLNDEKTNKLLSDGNTVGIFQLESPGMINTLRKVNVNSFEDLVAIISLFRPGPMSNISSYTKRKFKEEKIDFLCAEYDDIVKLTYGIIIYQEQIMEISQKFAGMRFGQADLLRRAISKKDKNEIHKLKETFVNGALEKNHPIDLIEKIYKEIEKFAEYGFNKSHAVAYSLLSYRMAYLKTWYPIEFYTAIISTTPGLDIINKYVVEAKSMNYKIISPEINTSKNRVFNKDDEIILPLIIIKGLGKIACEKIKNDKEENGIYSSFYNFIARAKRMNLGDSIIDILIRSNTLRSFGNMSTLTSNLIKAKLYASCVVIAKDETVFLDFSLSEEQNLIINDINIIDEMNYESQYLGAIYNAFPTINYESKDLLKNLSPNIEFKIVLFVEKIQEKKKDKNGSFFGIATLSDSSGKEDIFIFSPNWDSFKNIKIGSLIECKIIKNSNSSNFNIKLLGWRIINEK